MRQSRTGHVAASILAFGSALACVMPLAAQAAEAYPARPIRVLVGYAPGGVNDLVAREHA